ncbi:hypothetical protein [Streptomyces sp. NPDC050504]|uniref:hypothetical protein n=1 Tax=Streptomyces sp. NPDC050504 TaxID=3365618 RepID=UPI0037A4A5A6
MSTTAAGNATGIHAASTNLTGAARSPKTLPGVPRWAELAAQAAAWANVPSGLWRLAIAVGIPVGLAQVEYDRMHAPGWGSFYLLFLTALSEGLALLTLGLIRQWGETWPRFIPFVGGRPVSVKVATGLGAFGAVATTIYGAAFIYSTFHADMEGARWAIWLLNATYAPMILWGPALGAVTVHYYQRRTRGARGEL